LVKRTKYGRETSAPAGFEQIDEGDDRLVPLAASLVADAAET
jgi:hypothetical protein